MPAGMSSRSAHPGGPDGDSPRLQQANVSSWPKAAVQENCAAAEGAAALRRHVGTGRCTKAPTADLIADQSRSGCVMSTSLDRGIHAQSICLQESFHERLAQRGEQDNEFGPRPSHGGQQAPGCCASSGNRKADRRLLERHGVGTYAAQEEPEVQLSDGGCSCPKAARFMPACVTPQCLARPSSPAQSAVAPESLTTLLHFTDSLRMKSANCSGFSA